MCEGPVAFASVDSTVLTIETGERRIVDLTPEVRAFSAGKGDGLLSVFAPHATAGVAVMETGAGSPASTGIVTDGATSTGSTWSAPCPGEPWAWR